FVACITRAVRNGLVLRVFGLYRWYLRPSGLRFMRTRETPADVAARAAQALRRRETDAFRRETFALPREAAREKAREVFRRYPKRSEEHTSELQSLRHLVCRL